MGQTYYFVENLSLVTWIFIVWPRLLRDSLHKERIVCCYAIDGSPLAFLFAKMSAWPARVPVLRLEFRLGDMQTTDGESIRWLILYNDLARFQSIVTDDPSFQQYLDSIESPYRLPAFLAKQVIEDRVEVRGNLRRGLHLIRICQWKLQETYRKTVSQSYSAFEFKSVLFLEQTLWLTPMGQFAHGFGISLHSVPSVPNPISNWKQLLPEWAKSNLRLIRYLSMRCRTNKGSIFRRNGDAPRPQQTLQRKVESRPRVAIDYYGQGNLDNPERYSELFFWQNSSMDGGSVICLLPFPEYPLNEKEWVKMQAHGVEALRLHPAASSAPDIPLFNPRNVKVAARIRTRSSQEHIWLNSQRDRYERIRNYWNALATERNIKLYLTWDKYDARHFAISDAMENLGGITGIFQRAYETHHTPENTINADLVFGFSKRDAEQQRRSNSKIRYHITTGYLGDHRFKLVRENANLIREQLVSHGAKRILAFFDENSSDAPRWRVGHHVPQTDYAFWLEKVLTEPWLGLIIKPKVPRNLPRRLGEVADLLQMAIDSGRCYIHRTLEDAPLQGWHPPSEAALASDLAVHGDLVAATAGIEAALAGVPTLLYDPLGWPSSPLYSLGIGKTVFTDWESLWGACKQHWSDPQRDTGVGDWSAVLDDLDPFRDGRASERMGNYVQWILEGFEDGLNRETVMANAAERYAEAWGRDKVTQID